MALHPEDHKVSHSGADRRSMVGFFTRQIMRDMRLDTCYELVYGKAKVFVRDDTPDVAAFAKNYLALGFKIVDEVGFDYHPPASLAELATALR